MLRFDCFCLRILELLLTESRASDTSLQLNLRHMGRYQVRVKDNRSIYCCAYYFSARHNWCFVFIFVIHVAVRVKQREYVALIGWPTVAISTKLKGT